MTRAQSDIARLLGSARRRQAGITLLSRLGVGLAAAMICLLAGAVALRSGARLPARWIALGAAAAALVAALAWAIRDLVRRLGGDGVTARTVAAGDPALRSALQSSVELLRDRDAIASSGNLSVALVDAHVERTAERARTVDLARALPSKPVLQAGWLLLAVVGGDGVDDLVRAAQPLGDVGADQRVRPFDLVIDRLADVVEQPGGLRHVDVGADLGRERSRD